MRTKESNDDVRGEKMTLRAGSESCRERESLLFFLRATNENHLILFMSFPTVPAVQPWSCHPEDYHFTQHLTETQRETKSRKRQLEERVRKGIKGRSG